MNDIIGQQLYYSALSGDHVDPPAAQQCTTVKSTRNQCVYGLSHKKPRNDVIQLGLHHCRKAGTNHSGNLEKANILKDQFTSVFTDEDTTNVPTVGPSPFRDLEQIEIHPNGMKMYLISLTSK